MPSSALMEPVPSTAASPEELVAFVEKAYEYAHVHGQEAALKEFNNKSGRFVDGELYIFAYDSNGTTLALPFQPELIGTDRWNITDPQGTKYIHELKDAAQSGGGFVRYLYADPSDNFTVKQKLSFVMMVDRDWFIGAGIYDPQVDSPVVKVGTDPQVREGLKSIVGGGPLIMPVPTERMLRSQSSMTRTAHSSAAIYTSMPLTITEQPWPFLISPSLSEQTFLDSRTPTELTIPGSRSCLHSRAAVSSSTIISILPAT